MCLFKNKQLTLCSSLYEIKKKNTSWALNRYVVFGRNCTKLGKRILVCFLRKHMFTVPHISQMFSCSLLGVSRYIVFSFTLVLQIECFEMHIAGITVTHIL